ncbi:MAG: hypothetical protein A2275_03005 [Bacteroidetes bacterium RIFOXYA12_FULL_35_11]|nr:MAG: hypothetical protein A2X01_01960 [Bacteroidetes bacterium GWF2_35_48]OFY75747.1 MAG: hypothetical protein A2275_03005 [Bacteroidetes bacterium RIFOXYA12_FULL_35_11]OFY97585.1 MAG: hypothetical protein A2309_07845 [Bacteroidetes bacterium RIFOXYB2_FULL_35_7]OFZ00374.1 MAG: hypothetical protein A2491_12400 [Bacteroidetes bacterium RIFOXYC12_FULL_35_7]HBX51502.1 single-stranded DNA-binding protein [Bacteroidales bacterium]
MKRDKIVKLLKFIIMENVEKKSTNSVELKGNAGVNPEITKIGENNRIARFSLATTRNYQNKAGEWISETTWHKIVMWNKLADQAMVLVKKGACIKLNGRIVNRTYTDKTGNKRMSSEVYAESFENVAVKTENNENAQNEAKA